MMKLSLMFRLIFSLILLSCIACSEIDRDNLLDPGNPSSTRENTILVEAFINTSSNIPAQITYNKEALNALEELKNIYKDRIIVCEYHWNTTNPVYLDPLSLNNSASVYDTYIDAQEKEEERVKGVPDIFINGALNRVQGASSAQNVVNRAKVFAGNILDKMADYTLEADIVNQGNNINITYRIARLGNQTSDEMRLRILTTYNSGETGTNTVNIIELPIIISQISAGKFKEDKIEIDSTGKQTDRVVLILLDQTASSVLCVLEKEI